MNNEKTSAGDWRLPPKFVKMNAQPFDISRDFFWSWQRYFSLKFPQRDTVNFLERVSFLEDEKPRESC